MPFDSKYALNDAIRYLTKVAERRASGGWIPPNERECQQRDAMRQEQQQARQVEKKQKEMMRQEQQQARQAERQQQAQQKQFISDEKERQKNLAAFQKGNHPDVPHVLYHGTTGDYDVFDRRKANIESDHGKGFYASNNIEDVNPNYAGEGPDLTGKIERFIERNFYDDDENEMTPDEMREAAKNALNVHHRGAVMPIHVSMKNPVVIGGKNETFYDFEHPYDEKTDEYGEPKGSLLKVIDGVERAAEQFDVSHDALQDFKGRLYERAMDNGGIHASDLEKLIKNHFQNTYDNETGDYAEKELWRTAMEETGHDGIIDHTVNSKFGTDRRGFAGARIPGMAGVNADTSHYIVFSPNQIKSATGNQGTFNPSSPRINEARGGPILSKQYPTHYMPEVGRQVMADGGKSKKHPALSIAGTHIRQETHGDPIFTGRL